MLSPLAAVAQSKRVPHDLYFQAISLMEDGDYEPALEIFERELRGGVKTAESRWIDSICYYAMIGECHYRLGRPRQSLDALTSGLKLSLKFSDWLSQVRFTEQIRPATDGQIKHAPWGRTGRTVRLGTYPDTNLIAQGKIDNDRAIAQGGIFKPPVLFPVNAAEIVRATALALHRRRELLGPAAPHDPLELELAQSWSNSKVPAAHWSQAWVDVHLGMIFVAAGKDALAQPILRKAVAVGGEFDHPLSAITLLELGRMEFASGSYDAAANLFLEASYSAYQFSDPSVIAEALDYGHLSHLMANRPGAYPPLVTALAWAKKEKYRELEVTLRLALAESAARAGDIASANQMLGEVRARMERSDLPQSRLGARFQLLSSQLAYTQGQVATGDAALAAALKFQAQGSIWLWHIELLDSLVQSGIFSPRDAIGVYAEVLREPRSSDWATNPLESLSILTTPNLAARQRWFEIALARKQDAQALEIADLARRHVFFTSLPVGGRLLALRWLLHAPAEVLPKQGLLERQELLGQFPDYARLTRESAQVRSDLAALPLSGDEPKILKQINDGTARLAAIAEAQEKLLRQLSVRRYASTMAFPLARSPEKTRAMLPPRTAILSFFVTPARVQGFLADRETISTWEVGARSEVYAEIGKFLAELGNHDVATRLSAAEYDSQKWRELSRQLLGRLVKVERTDWYTKYDELVIVPDGALWYLPFEALGQTQAGLDTLITRLRIRYAPTVASAYIEQPSGEAHETTVVATGRLFSRDPPEVAEGFVIDLEKHALPVLRCPERPLAVRQLAPLVAKRLIVWDEIAPPTNNPYQWTPLPARENDPFATAEAWLALPFDAPRELMLPGFATAAARSFKGIPAETAGLDLFLPACAILGSGSKTLLISRWRTGGRVAQDLVREFVQELPHTSPADAWQRSVFLAAESDLNPDAEPRFEARDGRPRKAAHPFFWSGYMLFDSGRMSPEQLTADVLE